MSKRVLVVDDHPAVTLAMKVAFRLDGRFELGGSALTAAEGLEQTQRARTPCCSTSICRT